MKRLKLLLSLTTFLLLFGLASQTYADISDAALLYLRIAPGARAAGMGEAFVAIADDATATHWNPAGLGASPLATNWQNKNVPVNLQPITEMATVKARGGSGHNQFDIWTISAEGLARFDNHKWFTYEVFSTRTDQTVPEIVKTYFNIDNDNDLAVAVAKVAEENSSRSYKDVTEFTSKVLAAVPDSYTDKEGLVLGLDSLKILYLECRINWSRYIEAENIFKDGFKDESLSEKEIDRINFAVEKAKTRFIPEELKIKYSSLFSGNITTIDAIGTTLLIGTDNGFYTFDGRKWRTFTTEDGLPSMSILSISNVGPSAYVGTDKGLVKYSGKTLSKVSLPEEAENGVVTSIGATNSTNIWAVINGELYHNNKTEWSNSHTYIAELDDTFESIAEKISIFKTESEINLIAERIRSLNSGLIEAEESEVSGDKTVQDGDTTLAKQTVESDSVVTEEVKDAVEPQTTHIPTEFTIEPGKPIVVPYALGIKGKINKIFSIGSEKIWIATDYGLYMFKNGEWKTPGYQTIAATAGQTLEDIASNDKHPILETAEYVKLLSEINEIDTSIALTDGQNLKVYKNPLAYQVNDISSKGGGLYIATKRGIYELYNNSLSKVDIGGMGNSNILNVKTTGEEIWFASDKKIAIKASGRSDISLMYAKWLPQLADDMYYMFIAGVTNIGGFGTVGFNVTYINYGEVVRTGTNQENLGTFDPFDVALTVSYGGSLRDNLKGGLSGKFIFSHLSRLGAGEEQGTGTATGVAIDAGLLWNISKRINIGAALTNIGPDISYIDAGQSDPLPRNLALGVKTNLLSSEYSHAIFTVEVNKSLVGVNDGFREELKQLVINGGFEYGYSDIFAVRGGYIWDDEGDVKTITLGFGVTPLDNFKFDFAYIPSNTNAPLANTLRISMQIIP